MKPEPSRDRALYVAAQTWLQGVWATEARLRLNAPIGHLYP